MSLRMIMVLVVVVFITTCVLKIAKDSLDRVADLEKKFTEFYHLEEVHGIYEPGGTLEQDTWVPRRFHNIASNAVPGQENVSIENDSFFIGKGTWSVACWSTAVSTDKAVLRLYNLTQDRVEACGQVLHHGNRFGCRPRLDTLLRVVQGDDDTSLENEYQLQIKVLNTWETGKGTPLRDPSNLSSGSVARGISEDEGNLFVLSCIKLQRIGN